MSQKGTKDKTPQRTNQTHPRQKQNNFNGPTLRNFDFEFEDGYLSFDPMVHSKADLLVGGVPGPGWELLYCDIIYCAHGKYHHNRKLFWAMGPPKKNPVRNLLLSGTAAPSAGQF